MISKWVADTDGYEYILKSPPLSQGGQGAIYTEESDKFVIKLLNRQDPKFDERLRRVQLLSLGDMHVTRIHRVLRSPDVGYVMQRLKGMQPIHNLIYPRDRTADYLQWYKKTGGVKRRIQLLKNLSTILLQLRNKGLIYGDLSPNNVFVSSNQNQYQVYLIDIDNLTYESQVVNRIFTPNYGAPELVRGEACISSRTDIFSFAVLVYELLCGGHPLKGDLVIDGEPELEQSALRGELPWVYHKQDEINASQRCLPKEAAFSPLVFRLLGYTFDNNYGLNEPQKRPTIADWANALVQASAKVLVCENCQWSYFKHRLTNTCPLCAAPRPQYFNGRVLLNYSAHDPEQVREQSYTNRADIAEIVLQIDQPYMITTSMLGMSSLDSDRPLAEVRITSKDRFVIRSLAETLCWADSRSGRQIEITDEPIELTTRAELHFGLADTPHRSLRFEHGGSLRS